MSESFLHSLTDDLSVLEQNGLYKHERQMTSAQSAQINIDGQDRPFLNLCSNNYLGLADNPALITSATKAMKTHGFGVASVRFICGTLDLHRTLEKRLATYLEKDDAILFASCFDANAGLFEALLGPQDAIISDSLNHASLIDGIRLSKAKRYRYANRDMVDLRCQLINAKAQGARRLLVVTDGVFSMGGTIAPLPEISYLSKEFDALVVVDDCHATGILGRAGKGTPWLYDQPANVDVLTGTFGKALGGALGGYICGPQPVIDMLRQRARPYLFSNSLPPAIVAASITALDMVEDANHIREKLSANTMLWRNGLQKIGFEILGDTHPIVPIMVGDAAKATDFQNTLYAKGIFVTAFSYPVVPKGQARIRTQMNARMTEEQIGFALQAFGQAGVGTGVC
ncbi:glycine C-acetyltransferase [Cognatishimia sp. MH4019]|uniref:glycine C-acetyltransferase n=1 Tax=Cognatishimia sp. MH4019 TaxID=2854030 RepID=UPI001CD7B592|nr:glycine C-acetyltransferase [Cognatishimia sp. MH4019]